MSKLHSGLIASIMLNLFLAGALVAGYASLRMGAGTATGAGTGTGKTMLNAGSLRIAGSELPAAERRRFRQALRQARQAMRPTIDASRAAKAEAAGLLRRTPVDQAAVSAALGRARAADMAVRAAVERRAVAFAGELPVADRAKLAEAMESRAHRTAPGTE